MFYSFRNIKIIFFLLLITFQVNLAQSLNFKNYSTDDGLPQSTVFDIIQDQKGFIWFGTEAGLGRFDGVNVKTYSLSDGLVGNNIGALFFDKVGALWIGTNSGLSILFENEIINYSSSNGLPDDFIYGISDDKDGNIWVATRYGGACKFTGNKILQYNVENGFPSNQLSGIVKDTQGNLWFSSVDKGIIKYDGAEFLNYSKKDGLLSNNVKTVFEDDNGLIWVGTDIGISTFDNYKFTNFSKIFDFPTNDIQVILQDKRGDVWFGSYGNGIYRFDGSKIFSHTGIESNQIRSGYIDRRGDIWFGTFLGGMNRLPADWFEIYDTRTGLIDNTVYPITEDKNGKLYFGHYGKGVSILENGKFSSISTKNGLISNDLSSILVDSRENIWFGTLNGVSKFSKYSKKSYNKYSGLKFDYILNIYEDSKSNVWFGGKGGLNKYSLDKQKFVAEYSSNVGLEKALINDIFEDKKGNIWFATHYEGLFKYNGRDFLQIDTSDGLPFNNIYSVTEDVYGNYWFGTDGFGIIRYDGTNFKTINKKDGLSSNVCYFILEDNNKLYVGTIDGMSILHNDELQLKDKIKIEYISKNEGIPDKELNQKAYFKDSKGYLWFGTMNGLIKIDPKKEAYQENLPVFLEQIIVSDGINEKKYVSVDEDLHYEQNNISFNFYSISFANVNNISYEFKLEGMEENFSKTNKNIVEYRALPPGTYHFWVKAQNQIKENNEAKLLCSFTIASPFYKTWWFVSTVVLLVILVIYLVYFYKTHQIKKRNAALETMVKNRTSELEIEKNKSDDLLHNILPSSLVDELKRNGKVKPRKFNSVSIMFTDFKSFTYTTSVLPPEELVYELNDIFKQFDSLVGKYGLEKLKTIGDSYMAACGIPNEIDDHAVRMVHAALDFQNIINIRNETSPIKWEMRLGIHSGSVVAGVVGTKKFTYDIWGDTVNIASRMESSGHAGEINISGYTYMLVRDYFDCEYRGKVETKGKGKIDMYFVKAINKTHTINNKSIFLEKKPLKQIV